VFHEHKREATAEKIAEKKVELVCVSPFSCPFSDDDSAYARITRPRNAETSRYGA
jgi:hypothetical protein